MKLLSIKQVAARVGVHKDTIRNWFNNGTFPAPKKLRKNAVLSRIAWLESDVDAWIEAL